MSYYKMRRWTIFYAKLLAKRYPLYFQIRGSEVSYITAADDAHIAARARPPPPVTSHDAALTLDFFIERHDMGGASH